MAYPSVTYTFANDTTADASEANTNFSDIIAGFSDGTKDLNMNAGTFAGAVTFNGNVTVGDATTDDLTVTSRLASSLIPKTTATYHLGSTSLRYADIYGTTAYADDFIASLGAVGTPSYTFAGDTNTGMYSAGDDTINFATAGTLRVAINSSGNVSMDGSCTANGGFACTSTSGSLNSINGNSSQLTNTQFNRVIIGGSKSEEGSIRYGILGSYYNSASTSNETCGYVGLSSGDGAVNYLWTDDSDQLRISTTAGHMGTTSGTVVGTQTSDERTKDNILPISYGLSEVMRLSPVQFDQFGFHKVGFVAQETKGIIPECVFDTKEDLYDDPDNTKLGMEYVQIIPVLTRAIQEQQAIIESLLSRIETLESKQ